MTKFIMFGDQIVELTGCKFVKEFDSNEQYDGINYLIFLVSSGCIEKFKSEKHRDDRFEELKRMLCG